MYKQRLARHKAADLIFSLVAEAGGEASNYFDDLFSAYPAHTLRTIRYPKRVTQIPEAAYLPSGKSGF